jgi:hypothetical protein
MGVTKHNLYTRLSLSTSFVARESWRSPPVTLDVTLGLVPPPGGPRIHVAVDIRGINDITDQLPDSSVD